VFPSLRISGGSGSVSGSYSRSLIVGCRGCRLGKLAAVEVAAEVADGGDQRGVAGWLTARRSCVTVETDRRSIDLAFESGLEGTGPPAGSATDCPSRFNHPLPPRTLAHSPMEPTMDSDDGHADGANLRSRRAMAGRIICDLWLLLYVNGVRHAHPFAWDALTLPFWWYRLRIYQSLHWRRFFRDPCIHNIDIQDQNIPLVIDQTPEC